MDKKVSELLERGVEEVIDKNHLAAALESGKKLRVKLGIDPTSPNIHIGRAVVLWKLRAFQDLGHKVIFIVGDFTGLVGDTSDKDAERPMLTEKEVKTNLKTYFKQAFKILDKSQTETAYNSKWLKKLGLLEIAKMANLFGLHEFSAREVIARRIKMDKRVSLRELFYPLMQGYDSVAVKADVELGGTDQRFNLLAGRTIQKANGQAPQDILMTELLLGIDGRKMSSSWGNVINITDTPDEMFGRIMSIADYLMEQYFKLATMLPIDEYQKLLKNESPRNAKARLALEIVKLYHGEKKAKAAQDNFEKKFGKKTGEVNPDLTLKKETGTYSVVDLLVEGKLAFSKSEARRKLEEGAVEADGEKLTVDSLELTVKVGTIIRLGKRFLKIV
jgi:tyrosyl-tRNA synthetase